jgi:hypothetical protein
MKSGIYQDPNFQFQVDGDDSWMLYRRDLPHPTPAEFAPFGMTTKIEAVGLYPEDVGFCQAKPVILEDGPMMCRDYRRVLARLPYTIQRYSGVAWLKYAKGVAECELALGKGVPVLDAIQESLRAQTADCKQVLRPRCEEYQYAAASRVCNPTRQITAEARLSYALAWDISAEQQIALEERIRQHRWLFDYTNDPVTEYNAT